MSDLSPTKRCCRCGQVKTVGDMHRTRHRTYGYCKLCLYAAQMIRWNRRKAMAVAHLGGKCARCGSVLHPACYDFHHTDQDAKDVEWGKLRLRTWDAIVAELARCELVCAICHRLIHLNPILWPDHDLSAPSGRALPRPNGGAASPD